MPRNLAENAAMARALAPSADLWTGTKESDRFNLGRGRNLTFLVDESTGTTGTTVLTVQTYIAATGGSATAVAFRYRIGTVEGVFGDWIEAAATGFTTTAGGDQLILIEINAEELPDGNKFASLKGVEGVDAATLGSVIGILSDLRHPQRIPAAATV